MIWLTRPLDNPRTTDADCRAGNLWLMATIRAICGGDAYRAGRFAKWAARLIRRAAR